MSETITSAEQSSLFQTLKLRFEKFKFRHEGVEWSTIEAKLQANPQKLFSLFKMEETGGEPDVVGYDSKTNEYVFIDCSSESPKGRRSLCYDREALDSRKEFKPLNSVIDFAQEMGIELLNEEQYRMLQSFGKFDTKTSSWIKTPENIRKLDGAIFADYRYDTVFIYHNGASSYYASRGFRGILRV